ncbi:nucleotide exchange factor GrpE [Candidatus Methylomicrobium oryzae]|jgi:molecular chaperone GrpE|uniref:nucleotide exchange factor GrpE n=1 Tax=Candidatus Methylomicrobium oryzae TaxID=2802053 RepID=UPI001922BB5F|nr:nucleotide exchange factor GrpE [Methylomicrobium sp. RS1]MBL1264174.1 nucleotide exchange factor GrpE [Methylomicrobium sp. RS1]
MSNEQENLETQVKNDAQPEVQNSAAAEAEAPATGLAEQEPTVEQLQAKLDDAERKAQENWDKAVRTVAEMENLRRRTQRDIESAHKFALENFAKALLPVMDSLVLGLQAATGDSPEVQKFREGTELTLKQLEAVFNKFSIETVDPLGQPFNAEQHQAMMMQEIEGAEPNTVVNVFQKGYMLNGRLLRPAMVVVAKAPQKPSSDTPIIDEQA